MPVCRFSFLFSSPTCRYLEIPALFVENLAFASLSEIS